MSCAWRLIEQTLFRALVQQTMFRPRDLIMLIKILQEEIERRDGLNEYAYVSAIKRYSDWLVNTEIANEINPVFGKDYKYVIELLRQCGPNDIGIDTFKRLYSKVDHIFEMEPLDMLEYLYSVGVIENYWVNDTTKQTMRRSVFRNETPFDHNKRFKIIKPVWRGLTV